MIPQSLEDNMLTAPSLELTDSDPLLKCLEKTTNVELLCILSLQQLDSTALIDCDREVVPGVQS